VRNQEHLNSIFGTSSIEEAVKSKHVFTGGNKQATSFVKMVCLYSRWQCKIKSKNEHGKSCKGSSVTYVCSCPTYQNVKPQCEWFVRYCRRKNMLMGCRLTHHATCILEAMPTTRTMNMLPELNNLQPPSSTRHITSREVTNVVSSTLNHEFPQSKLSNVFRHINDRERALAEKQLLCSHMPSLLQQYILANKNATCCIMLDKLNRLFRTFISNPVSIDSIRWSLGMGLDASFGKGSFNGSFINLVSLDAHRKLQRLCFAIVHRETIDNYVWFIQMCVAAGVDFRGLNVFIDRGKARNAGVHLGGLINFKYCLFHIKMNVNDKFFRYKKGDPSSTTTLRGHISAIQSSDSFRAFKHELSRFSAWVTETEDKDKAEKVMKYLSAIHPVNYAVFANDPSFQTSTEYKEYCCWVVMNVHDIYISQPRSLNGISTNNISESENSRQVWSGLRTSTPADAACQWIEDAQSEVASHCESANALFLSLSQFTGYAVDEMDRFNDYAKMYLEVSLAGADDNQNSLFQVRTKQSISNDNINHSRDSSIVNVGAKQCCASYASTGLPCIHILAVSQYYRAHGYNDATSFLHTFVHERYLSANYIEQHANKYLIAVVKDNLTTDEAVKESPVYKNGGRINNGRRLEKRYKSAGEFGVGGSTQAVTQSTTSLTRMEGIAHPSRQHYYLLYFVVVLFYFFFFFSRFLYLFFNIYDDVTFLLFLFHSQNHIRFQ